MLGLAQRLVVVAQLVERWLVVPDVAGSNPVDHPNSWIALVPIPQRYPFPRRRGATSMARCL